MRVITYKDLKPLKGIPFSREHLRRLEAAGRFPKRIRLTEGGDYNGYVEKEIDEYLAARAAALRRWRDVGRTKPGVGRAGLQ
jgi:prophage regulatory protein